MASGAASADPSTREASTQEITSRAGASTRAPRAWDTAASIPEGFAPSQAAPPRSTPHPSSSVAHPRLGARRGGKVVSVLGMPKLKVAGVEGTRQRAQDASSRRRDQG